MKRIARILLLGVISLSCIVSEADAQSRREKRRQKKLREERFLCQSLAYAHYVWWLYDEQAILLLHFA